MLFKCYADSTYVQVAVTLSGIACSRHLFSFKLLFMRMKNIRGGDMDDA